MGFNLFGLGKKIEDILGGVGNQAQHFFGGAQNQVQNIVREAPQQTQNIWSQGQRAVNNFVQPANIQAPQLPRVDFSKLSQDMNMPRVQVNQRALDQNKAVSDFTTGATKWAFDHTVKPIWDEAYKTQAAISNKYENPNAPTLMDRVRKEGVLGGIKTQAQKTVAPTTEFGSTILEKGIQASPIGSIARETLKPVAWATPSGKIDNPVTNYLTGGPVNSPEVDIQNQGFGKTYLQGVLDRANIAALAVPLAKGASEGSYFGPPRTKPGLTQELNIEQFKPSVGKPVAVNVTQTTPELNLFGRLLNKVGVKTNIEPAYNITPSELLNRGGNSMGIGRVIPTQAGGVGPNLIPEVTGAMNVPRVIPTPTTPIVQPPTQPTGVQVNPTVVKPTPTPAVTPPSTTIGLPAPTPVNIPNVAPGVIPPEMNPTGVVKVGDKYTITDTSTGKIVSYNTAKEAQDALDKMPKYPAQEQITPPVQETPKPQFLSEKQAPQNTQVISLDKAKELSAAHPEEFANAVNAGKIQVEPQPQDVTPQIRPKPQAETPQLTPEVAKAVGGTPPPESPAPPPAQGEVVPQFDPTKTKSGKITQVKKLFSDQDQVVIDTLRDIEKRTGQKGLVKKFMYDSNMVRASNAGADVHITGSQGFNDALQGMSKKEYKLFSEYANARTELSTADKMTNTSMPVEDLRAITEAGDARFGKRFEALNQHYQSLADVLHKAGVISDEKYNFYKSNNEYIRIQRDMGDLIPPNVGKTKSRSLSSTITSQTRKGSSRAILPAGETAADFTQSVYREAAKNTAGNRLIKILKDDGQAKLVKNSKNRNTVSIYENGVKRTYEVSADMKQAIDNINPYTMNVVMQALALPGRVFRAGVTGLNPVFIVRNVVKDQAGSFINSENVMATHNPKSMWEGLWGATKNSVATNNDPLFQDFLRHYGNQTSYDLTRNSQNAAQLVNRTRGGKLVGVGQAVKSPIRSLENLASITEISTRFQNYRGEYVKAIKQGLPKEAASERAAIAAWQNSVDFSRAGEWGRAINTVIPYWNPATQGVRQMVRSATTHPVNTLFKAFAVIGAPLLAATMWNNSSEDTKKVWNNIPQYDKENNIILIPPGTTQNEDGTYDVIKIPMSPGWKDPFVAMARAYDAYANDKPQDAAAMGMDVLNALTGPVNIRTPEQLIGSVTPQLIKPLVQQAMNKDLFTGQNIVSDYINNATDAQGNPVPESQKAYATGSGSADIIGGKLGVSPIRVEKFIKDIGGTVGQNVQNAADRTLASMGVIDQNKIGGQSIAEGFAKSFEKSRGIVNENASPGQKYYETIKEVTSNMTGNEKSAFQALHPDKKNFLGDVIYENDSTYNPAARLDIYNRYPKVFEADKQLDAKGRAEGRPGNPLFDLTPQQVKKVLEKENLPPGAKDPELSNLYSQDWYAEYRNKRTQYFSGIKESQKKDLAAAIASGDTKSAEAIQSSIDKFSTQTNPYPDTPPELQKVMDYYNNLPKGTGARSQWIRSNPGLFDQMKNQWAAVDKWQNNARGKRGLAATEGDVGKANGYGTTSSNSYSGGGGSKKPNLYGTGDPYKYIVSAGEAGFSNTKVKARKAKPLAKAKAKPQQPKVSVRKSMV